MIWRLGALLAVLSLACAHAKQVETPAQARPEPAPEASAVVHTAPPKSGHPALSVSPGGTFEPGAVRELQKALGDAGFHAPENGQLDETTRHQISRYQKEQLLPDTGYPDDATLRKLGLDPAKLHRSNH